MYRWLLVPVFGLMLLVSSHAQAANWGSFKDDGCASPGFRKFSAILWNVPSGASWEAACASTPAVDWGTPTRCVNSWGHMWGEWYRPDADCK